MSFNNTLVTFGTPSTVTATRGSNDPEVGTRWQTGGNDYVFVYNGSTGQASPGQAMNYTGVTGYSVNVSVAAGNELIAGVVYHATLTTGTYGWLLTRGFGKVATSANVSASTGAFLTPSTNGFWILGVQTSALTDALQPIARAKAMETIASGTAGNAYISVW